MQNRVELYLKTNWVFTRVIWLSAKGNRYTGSLVKPESGPTKNSFIKDTSKKTGQSISKIKEEIQISNKVIPEAKELLKNHFLLLWALEGMENTLNEYIRQKSEDALCILWLLNLCKRWQSSDWQDDN